MTASKREEMLEHLREGRFESVLEVMKTGGAAPRRADFGPIMGTLDRRARGLRTAGEIGLARNLERRIRALAGMRDHGPDPSHMIAEVELPEIEEAMPNPVRQRRDGKILMVAITGGVVGELVCLRSGDEWHREILRNTEREIHALGFTRSRVDSLGGAHVVFREDGSIQIRGVSDYYGACDKELAAGMIRKAFPGRRILVKQ